jgi:hypothetical protein
VKSLLICLGVLTMFLVAGACSAAPPQAEEPPSAAAEATSTSTPVPPTRTPTLVPRTSTRSPEAATATPPAEDVPDAVLADVISVEASGEPGAYRFSVGIRSPDTGCDQYADWWEVVSEEGELLYRRVLLHSHVDEQPFARSGGPIDIEADMVVWVRAHMNTGGYGGAAFRGSVEEGFAEAALDAAFAAELEGAPPLPDGCAF